VGVRDLPQGRYVALQPGAPLVLALTADPPRGPYLLSANAAVASFQRDGQTARLRLRGHVPVEAEIGGCAGALSARSAPPATAPTFTRASAIKARRSGNIIIKNHTLQFTQSDTGDIDVVCH